MRIYNCVVIRLKAKVTYMILRMIKSHVVLLSSVESGCFGNDFRIYKCFN